MKMKKIDMGSIRELLSIAIASIKSPFYKNYLFF